MSTINLIYQYFPIVFPLMALMLSFQTQSDKRLAANIIGTGALIVLVSVLVNKTTNSYQLNHLLSFLVLLVGFVVFRFSLNYMRGSCGYHQFFVDLSCLLLLLCLMLNVDNLFFYVLYLTAGNILLCRLINHHRSWSASKKSSRLAFLNLGAGSILLFISIILLFLSSGCHSFSQLPAAVQILSPTNTNLILSGILLAAMLQSAIWPFHRWLISSLNSPTPVSALMHAGMINGGGILLIKFSILLNNQSNILIPLFIVGSLSAFIGSGWMMIQTSIKRNLACSTLSQMGFMMMQCGLGLFSAATAHLLWHGLYKAYQFLASGSAVAPVKTAEKVKNWKTWLLSFPAGFAGAFAFAMSGRKHFDIHEADFILLIFAFIAAAQLGQNLLSSRYRLVSLLNGILLASVGGAFYGHSIFFIEKLVPSLWNVVQLHLSAFHFIFSSLFLLIWAVLATGTLERFENNWLWQKIYVRLLNSSQPKAETISANKSEYQYS